MVVRLRSSIRSSRKCGSPYLPLERVEDIIPDIDATNKKAENVYKNLKKIPKKKYLKNKVQFRLPRD